MPSPDNIDHILQNWEFDPRQLHVRMVEADGREVIQMRLDMGLLQMEHEGRPDGLRPDGFETYLDQLRHRAAAHPDFQLDEAMCMEVDREFVQFYHRRICWLQLKRFGRAVADADHTLALMDFCAEHSPNEQWKMSHEQYRPFVIYHRTQALALDLLDGDDPQAAIEAVNHGLQWLKDVFVDFEVAEHYEEDELVQRLVEFREGLRDRYRVGRTLQEQLSDAIASEQYELAAKLRDQLEGRRQM